MPTYDELNAELQAALDEEKALEEEVDSVREVSELEVERAKVRAAGWTSLGVNLVTVGVFAQIITLLFSGIPEGFSWDSMAAIMTGCLAIAFFLHFEGQEALRKGYSL